MNKILIAVLPFLLLTGCSSYVSRYFFDYKRTDNSSTEFIQKDEIYARYKYYFEDDFIKLRTDCEPYGLGLYLSNKTDNAVRIIWDSVKVFSDYLKDNSISIIHLNKSQDNIQIPDSTSSDFGEKNLLVNLIVFHL